MSDFPAAVDHIGMGGVIGAYSPASLVFDIATTGRAVYTTAAAWPAANLALYIPILVERTVTAYKMAFEVGAQAGNCDVGIYDELGNRLVSAGSTAVGPAGLQVIDITDTVLTPGVYYLAINMSTITTLTIMRSAPSSATTVLQMMGMRQQAVGAVTLPDPATFANVGQTYIPAVCTALKATI